MHYIQSPVKFSSKGVKLNDIITKCKCLHVEHLLLEHGDLVLSLITLMQMYTFHKMYEVPSFINTL